MENTIIVRLIGGLGNQFFQYAAAKAIALKNGFQLKLDLTSLGEYSTRKFELDKFNVELNYAIDDEIKTLKRKKFFKKTYFKEQNGKFNPKILKIKNSAYLMGYWQSEKYFKDIEKNLKNEFTFKSFDFIKNQAILDEIRNCNSVSINWRCQEYMNDTATAKIHNVCTMKFYENAIKYMKEKTDNPTFYVFSDDINWVKANFKPDEPVIFVDTENWQEDLYFMENCKHNIIANSSFSWLAAWLNPNPEKIVVAPKKWFTDEAKINYESVVPENWVKIEV